MKKTISTFLSLVMLLSILGSFGGIPAAAATPEPPVQLQEDPVEPPSSPTDVVEHKIKYPIGPDVDPADQKEVTAYRYTPDGFKFRGLSTAMTVVLGDTPYTRESAAQAVEDYGFDEMAKDDFGYSHVVFVNPVSDSGWTEEDYLAIQAVISNTTDAYTVDEELEGKYDSGALDSGIFCSGLTRSYIFAEKSAVPFAKTYLDTEDAMHYIIEWGNNIVDGFGAGFYYAEEGFTKAGVLEGWDSVKGTTRVIMSSGYTYLGRYDDYEALGITRTVNTFTGTSGSFEYYMYVPSTVDMNSASEKYPLMFGFHGRNMHPEAFAQLSDWPVVGAKNDFVVVAPNGNPADELVIEFIEWITSERAIDKSKIYSTGYSMGGMKSWSLGFNYPEHFAAIIPTEGVPGMGIYNGSTPGGRDPGAAYANPPSLRMPVFYIGGQEEFYTTFPSTHAYMPQLLKTLSQANGYAYNGEYDETIGGWWGMEFDKSYVFAGGPVADDGRGTWNIHELRAEDGIAYTVMSDVTKLGHSVFPVAAEHIWDTFASKFSRAEDGSIETKPTYPFKLISETQDDGPYIIALAIDMGEAVDSALIDSETFEIHARYTNPVTGVVDSECDREISRIYLNDKEDVSADGVTNGRYIIVEMPVSGMEDPKAWAQVFEKGRSTYYDMEYTVIQKKAFNLADATSIFDVDFSQAGRIDLIADEFEYLSVTMADENELPYRLFVPADTSKPQPIVIWIHGAGEIGTDNNSHITMNTGAVAWAYPENQAKRPAYVMAAQTSSRWDANRFDAMREVVEEMIADGRVDENRVYITGCSMGGGGNWNFVLRHPDLFAASMPICPLSNATEDQIPSIAHIPTWQFHAANDKTIPVTRSRDFNALMQEKGANFYYTEFEDVGPYNGHFAWIPVMHDYVDPVRGSCMDWLFAQTKTNATGIDVVEHKIKYPIGPDVKAEDQKEVTAYRYTPDGFKFRGLSTAMTVVLGDAPYTKESAEQAVIDYGFDEMAKDDFGYSHVVFVNPVSDSGWTEEDYLAIQAVISNTTDAYTVRNEGSGKYDSGALENGVFCSGLTRSYIFAEKSAAQFAKTYLDTEDAMHYIIEWGNNVVDGFGAGFYYAEEGFTKEGVLAGWDSVKGTTRVIMSSGYTYLGRYDDYEALGITRTVNTFTGTSGSFEYYMYVPSTVDMNSATEKYPLMFGFHGSNMHPEAFAQLSDWPVVGAKKDFVVVAPNGNPADALVIEFIEWITSERAIDKSKIYSTGYSMGGMKSWSLGFNYPEYFAAIIPTEGVPGMNTSSGRDPGEAYANPPSLRIPVFYIAGQEEFYTTFPSNHAYMPQFLATLAQANGYTYNGEYDETIGGWWGMKFDKSYVFAGGPVADDGRGTWNIHELRAEDGIAYTVMSDVTKLGHSVFPVAAEHIWDTFASKFSRAEDGSIVTDIRVVEHKIKYPIGPDVKAEDQKEVTAYRYTPEGFKFRGLSTAMTVVLGDTPYTKESAEQAVIDYGFDEMAKDDFGYSHVVFVNPVGDSGWTEEDYLAIQAVISNTTDAYTVRNEGSGKYDSGALENGVFCSGLTRSYIFAEKSAAQFAKTYLDTEDAMHYIIEWGNNVVDGFGAGFYYADEGFTKEGVLAGWDSVKGMTRVIMSSGYTYLGRYDDYEALGITRTVNTFTGTSGSFEYYMYVPSTVDMNSATEKYPLMFGFHGSNMHPEAFAQLSDWPVVGAKKDFVVVAPNGNPADALVIEFIEWITSERAIDKSKIYSTGYSMGGMKSWSLGFNYPEYFAAIIPTEGVPGMGIYNGTTPGGRDPGATYANPPSLRMPVFYIGGQEEFYTTFPSTHAYMPQLLKTLSQANGYAYNGEYDETIGGWWGMEFDKSYVFDGGPVADDGRGTWNIHELRAEDGIAYTVMSDVTKLGHSVFPVAAEHIWDTFASKFSRAEDGSIETDIRVVEHKIKYPIGPDVKAEDQKEVTAYRYTPDGFKFRGLSTAMTVVLGDAPYTKESAAQAVIDYGFDEMAKDDFGYSHVVFVNPVSDSGWTEEDYLAIQAVISNTTDAYTVDEELEGKYDSGALDSGIFCSGLTRSYIFAEKSAVPFAKTYLDTEDAMHYIIEWGNHVVDGFGAGFYYAEEGFTKEGVLAGWDSVKGTTRVFMSSGYTYLGRYDDYEALGITRTVNTFTGTSGSFEYYMYVPSTVDMNSASEKYPLMFGFHGRNMHPEAFAQLSDWPVVGAKKDFVVVAPNGNPADELVVEFIEWITSERAIDKSKIYSTGYSMGGMKSWSLGFNYPEYFAAIIPTEGVPGMGIYNGSTPGGRDPGAAYANPPSLRMPVFYIGGQEEFYTTFPSTHAYMPQLLKTLSQANGYAYNGEYDETIGGWWGMEFDKSYVFDGGPVASDGRGTWNIHELRAEDGIAYTVMSDVTKLGHSVFPVAAEHIWDTFASKFSRSEDGSIETDPTAFSLAIAPSHTLLYKDETATLSLDVKPAEANISGVKWTSDNPAVVSVVAAADKKTAVVSAKAEGFATITAKLGDFEAKATVEVFAEAITEANKGNYKIDILDTSMTVNKAKIAGTLVPINLGKAAGAGTASISSDDEAVTAADAPTKITGVTLTGDNAKYFDATPYNDRYFMVTAKDNPSNKTYKNIGVTFTLAGGVTMDASQKMSLKVSETYPKITLTVGALNLYYPGRTATVTGTSADGSAVTIEKVEYGKNASNYVSITDNVITPVKKGSAKLNVTVKLDGYVKPYKSGNVASLTAKVVDAAPKFTVALKGKIDIINPNSAVTATVKLSGLSTSIASVALTDVKDGAFEAVGLNGNTFTIKTAARKLPVPGVKYSFGVRLTMSDGEVVTLARPISIKPTQSKAKAWQSTKSVTLYKGATTQGEEVQFDLTTPAGVKLSNAQINAASVKKNDYFKLERNGEGSWVLKFKDGFVPSAQKLKSSYTVKVELWADGAYDGLDDDGKPVPLGTTNSKGKFIAKSKATTVSVKVYVK